jgi:signal transduction histidine kinase
MHDDLGSGLSKIALLSEVLKQQSTDQPSRISLEKISTSAKEALETIGEIVWSLNPKNDTLENLTSYLRKYTVEYFEPTGINCKVKLPDKIPPMVLTGIQRRNVFLSVKEALHNIVKHSEARNARLTFMNEPEFFQIKIEDDGKGFDVAGKSSWGNGLNNMKKRVEDNGGNFELENKIGTTLRITFPVKDNPKG